MSKTKQAKEKRYHLAIMRITPGDTSPTVEHVSFNKPPEISRTFNRLVDRILADTGSVYRVCFWDFIGEDPDRLLYEFAGKVGHSHRLRVIQAEWDNANDMFIYSLPDSVVVDPTLIVK